LNIFYKICFRYCLVFLLLYASISGCVVNSLTRPDANYKKTSQSIPSSAPQTNSSRQPKKGGTSVPHRIVTLPSNKSGSNYKTSQNRSRKTVSGQTKRKKGRLPNRSTLPPQKLGPGQSQQFCASGNANINNISKSCSNGGCKLSGVKITCNNKSCRWCDARNRCQKILYNGTTSILGGYIRCNNGRCNYSVKNGGRRSNGAFSCRTRR